MKGYLKTVLIIFFVLFSLQQALVSAAPAENTELLCSEKYFEKVHSFFNHASKSIVVVMYSFRYYPEYPASFSNILLQDLINAKKRGVDVIVLLDISENFSEETTRENKNTGKILSKNGVKVYYDNVKKLMHAKTIVIDSMYTIIGSHNWTYSALSKNNEISVLINSEELAKETQEYIMEIINNKK
jgi:cardiolipin synthase